MHIFQKISSARMLKVLEEGEMVVGGVRPNIVDEETPWKDTLLLAESSMFGSSIAPYRNGGNGTGEKIYMKSLFHAHIEERFLIKSDIIMRLLRELRIMKFITV